MSWRCTAAGAVLRKLPELLDREGEPGRATLEKAEKVFTAYNALLRE